MFRVALMRCFARLSGEKNSNCIRVAIWSSVRLLLVLNMRLTLNSISANSWGVFSGCTTATAGALAVPGSLPLSARKASTSKTQNNKKVMMPSATSTTSGVMNTRMTNNQMYAKTEKNAVMEKTLISLILRVSPFGMMTMHTAPTITSLNVALPKIVQGPKSLDVKSLATIPTTLSRISKALEPKVIKVKLATVGVQTFTVRLFFSFLSKCNTFLDVTFSIAHMSTSTKMATPWKQYTRRTK
mmetsp:Transcript_10051/g.25143  ORF Transcript_10051/g.25143 Transcript_10051/m.25143 type:complete len:242 (-) Transcript_10051:170-895(-)